MGDDGSTISLRSRRSRELRSLRNRCEQHQEALRQLEASAPTETLASRYGEILEEIDRTLSRLDELEHPAEQAQPMRSPPDAAPTQPGWSEAPMVERPMSPDDDESRSRPLLMIVLAVILLAILGAMVWWVVGRDEAPPSLQEEALVAETTMIEEVPAEPELPALTVEPGRHDFGPVRKGTRAVTQFTLTNQTDQPLQVSIARSDCRCLWFDYADSIPAAGSIPLQVIVDGSRAEAGKLDQIVRIRMGSDETDATTITIQAQITSR